LNSDSFDEAELLVKEVLKWDHVDPKPIILVANKTDLARSRVVTKQGKLPLFFRFVVSVAFTVQYRYSYDSFI
jgi:GTPase SAR1 family protein